jgi:hypothetical protein
MGVDVLGFRESESNEEMKGFVGRSSQLRQWLQIFNDIRSLDRGVLEREMKLGVNNKSSGN